MSRLDVVYGEVAFIFEYDDKYNSYETSNIDIILSPFSSLRYWALYLGKASPFFFSQNVNNITSVKVLNERGELLEQEDYKYVYNSNSYPISCEVVNSRSPDVVTRYLKFEYYNCK
jgi:hypothetical protein